MPKHRMKRHAVTQPLDQPYRLIPLTQNQNAIVDAGDFDWLSQWDWYAVRSRKTFYPSRKINGRMVAMHQFILRRNNCDHRNRNGLDNRRGNLRRATRNQQARNRGLNKNSTSGFKGVHWERDRGKWTAHIRYRRKVIRLGMFKSKRAAARAYDAAARKYYKEYAFFNFPHDDHTS